MQEVTAPPTETVPDNLFDGVSLPPLEDGDGATVSIGALDRNDPRLYDEDGKAANDEIAKALGAEAPEKKPAAEAGEGEEEEEAKDEWSLEDDPDPEDVSDVEDEKPEDKEDEPEDKDDPHAANHRKALRNERKEKRELRDRLAAEQATRQQLEARLAALEQGRAPQQQTQQPAQAGPSRMPTPEEVTAWVQQNDPVLVALAKEIAEINKDPSKYASNNGELTVLLNRKSLEYTTRHNASVSSVYTDLQGRQIQAQQTQALEQQKAQAEANQTIQNYAKRISESKIPGALKAAEAVDKNSRLLHQDVATALLTSDDPDVLVCAMAKDRSVWKYATDISKQYNGRPIPAGAIAKLGALAAAWQSKSGKPAAQERAAEAPQAPRRDAAPAKQKTEFRRPKAGGSTAGTAVGDLNDPSVWVQEAKAGRARNPWA